MTAYYNEIDTFAADWLENLIHEGLIAPGVVDRRSIKDVQPADLRGFSQVHLYAGIGGWSCALRRAGWPDTRNVFTFSEPCQPYSDAGRGKGAADERYLRPYTHHLVSVCRPDVCFGEQVSSKAGLTWLDTLCADMEGAGYAIGAQDRCSAGVGAPHRRQRFYFAARRLVGLDHHHHQGSQRHTRHDRRTLGRAFETGPTSATSISGRLAHSDDSERRSDGARGHFGDRTEARWLQGASDLEGRCEFDGMADVENGGRREKRADGAGELFGDRAQGFAAGLDTGGASYGMVDPNIVVTGQEREQRGGELGRARGDQRASPAECRPGPTNGPWRNADWLFCRDGKWRPVEPDSFPLAYGIPSRVGRLRAFGNAIDVENARDWIETYLDLETFEGQPVRGVRDELFADLLG